MVRPFRIQYPEAAYHVMGVALATSSVTVNSQTPYRKGEYFRKEISVSNGSNPAWQSVTVAAPGETSVSGNAYVPKGPEQFAYDADGNLTGDGRWTYVWDAENRLVQMLPTTVITVPDGAKRKLDFVYDYKGRRIQKAVSTWNGTDWGLTVSNRFLYDAWNMVAELNATNDAVIRTYLWGLDLSGSLQGAGGVGGLLAISDSSKGRHFVSYDGNGNVMQTVASADGNISAVYEYGPFGEVIRATGPMAKANPFRFSTKYQDDESDLLYYGYRYYCANVGRWLSRDPLGEASFYRLHAQGWTRNSMRRQTLGPSYLFENNDGQNGWDVLGLWHTSDVITPNSEDSTIVCQNGKPTIRLSPTQDFLCPAVKKCAEKHEQAHKEDALKANPRICENQPDNTVIVYDGSERVYSERRAYSIQYDCVKKVYDIYSQRARLGMSCRCDDTQVYRWLDTILSRKTGYDNADPNVRSSWPIGY